MQSGELSFFLFGFLGEGWGFREKDSICYPQFVPTVFPSSLQGVPSKFPNSSQYVSNSTTLLTHMLWPKLNFHKYNTTEVGQQEAPMCFYFGECPMFQKLW
jgi:hypothetical protein